MKRLIPAIILLIISLVVWNFLRDKVYVVTDNDFVMRENKLAPDGNHRIIEFDIDIRALGYSG